MINTAGFFRDYYKKAKVNCFIIMDLEGTVIEVSQSFTENFGYDDADMQGKNFSILFSDEDNMRDKPGREIKDTIKRGQTNDENYLVDKGGKSIWVTGECVLVDSDEGDTYIVKDVVNLQSKKQLQLLLTATDEVLEKFYEASSKIPIMILDGNLKINKITEAFKHLFQLTHPVEEGDSLSSLNNVIWSTPEIKNELRQCLVNREPIKERKFLFATGTGTKQNLYFNANVISNHNSTRIYIMVDDCD